MKRVSKPKGGDLLGENAQRSDMLRYLSRSMWTGRRERGLDMVGEGVEFMSPLPDRKSPEVLNKPGMG